MDAVGASIGAIGVVTSAVDTIDRELQRHRTKRSDKDDIIIALMGETGSGKSSFIHRITGSDSVKIGHGLESETKSVEAYTVSIDERVITLIDTPGFDDTIRSDVDVLREVSDWLAESYRSQRLLSGIIYLHPITSVRMSGSSHMSLRVFTGLVGPDAFHNIMLVTSKWDQLGDLAGGVQREAELCERYWDFLIEKGSLTGRSYGDRQSALAIVRNIAFGRSASDMVSVPLALQKQMVDEHKSLEETSAGQALSQRIDHLKKDYDRQLMELKREHDLVNAQAQEDRRQMQAAIDHLRKGQLALSDEQFKLSNHSTISQQDNEVFTQYLKPQINVRIGMSEFLEADMPPPYSPPDPSQMSTRPASSRMGAFIVGAADTIIYSVNPVVESYRFLKPVVGKLFRPRLQEGYSRIEWKCSCGDILYGDYLERNPGSLRSLAAELGGRIISGPALNQAPANAQLPSPQTPAATHLKGASSGLSPSGSIGGPANIPKDGQSPTATGGQKASVVQQHGTGPKWLELCIPSTTGISSLVEIDTSGNCTDKMLFDAIRAQYHENKPSARWLGRFAYRVMNGGGSVMFVINKRRTTGSLPTVSILERRMPSKKEAKQYRYSFNPMPMDKQPIDPGTFRHYLKYPHSPNTSQAFIKRFPQLTDVSLSFHGAEDGYGWGIEITEERNPLLFAVCNIISLLLSGVVAVIYARYMKDNATGVAIGAWLTAVQAITVTAVLWDWTS